MSLGSTIVRAIMLNIFSTNLLKEKVSEGGEICCEKRLFCGKVDKIL